MAKLTPEQTLAYAAANPARFIEIAAEQAFPTVPTNSPSAYHNTERRKLREIAAQVRRGQLTIEQAANRIEAEYRYNVDMISRKTNPIARTLRAAPPTPDTATVAAARRVLEKTKTAATAKRAVSREPCSSCGNVAPGRRTKVVDWQTEHLCDDCVARFDWSDWDKQPDGSYRHKPDAAPSRALNVEDGQLQTTPQDTQHQLTQATTRTDTKENNMNLDANGPEEIRTAFAAAIEASGEQAEEISGIAGLLTEAAGRYEAEKMAAPTVGHLIDAAEAYAAAAASLSAAQEHLDAALTDFNAHDGAVGDVVADTGGNVASEQVLVADPFTPGAGAAPSPTERRSCPATPCPCPRSAQPALPRWPPWRPCLCWVPAG
jgi:hypothetical protein